MQEVPAPLSKREIFTRRVIDPIKRIAGGVKETFTSLTDSNYRTAMKLLTAATGNLVNMVRSGDRTPEQAAKDMRGYIQVVEDIKRPYSEKLSSFYVSYRESDTSPYDKIDDITIEREMKIAQLRLRECRKKEKSLRSCKDMGAKYDRQLNKVGLIEWRDQITIYKAEQIRRHLLKRPSLDLKKFVKIK